MFRLLIITLFALIATYIPPASANAPVFQPDDCPMRNTPAHTTCGTVTVPESRAPAFADDSNSIEIAVAVLRSTSANPLPDPIVFLDGGPGGHTLDFATYYASMFTSLRQDRDIILFDQRGTGHSAPPTRCAGLSQYDYDSVQNDDPDRVDLMRYEDALIECIQRRQQDGTNFKALTSQESATDVRDLIVALGYEQANLFGISYGTRLALTIMRDHPDVVRAAVLDSVYPPQIDSYPQVARNFERSLNLIAEACADSTTCHENYPDVTGAYHRLIDELNSEPQRITYTDFYTGASYSVLLTGSRIIDATFSLLYDTDVLHLIPGYIYRALDGDFQPFLDELFRTLYFNQTYISIPMYFAVECYEEIAFTPPDVMAALPGRSTSIIESFAIDNDFYSRVCERLEPAPVASVENQPVRSDIPALMLTGVYDPITPPAWAFDTAAYLASGYVFTFPGLSHGVYSHGGCPRAITSAFLNNPQQRPASHCLNTMPDLFERLVTRGSSDQTGAKTVEVTC